MAEDAEQAQAVEMLLKGAAARCRQHRAWRRGPFNLFSKLFDESDEVNLHSRFLAALLDHRETPDAPRANLEDFLIVVGCGDFDLNGATVERERDRIDILVTNTTGQAVAVENKIWAVDQPQQLWKYYKRLKCERYSDIIVLYLTLDGHEPEKQSVYDENCKCRVPEDRLRLISYARKLPPWLERCQERAYAEPRWREAIEQYLNLVRKLTGTGWREEYMKGLKELCMQGDNPRLIHDLAEALKDKKVDLLCDFLKDVENALKESIPSLPRRDKLEESNWDRVNGYIRQWRNCYRIVLCYPLGEKYAGAYLSAEISDGVYLGVFCHRSEHPDVYEKLQHILGGWQGHSDDGWPWYRSVDSSVVPKDFNRDKLADLEWKYIEFLGDEDRRKALPASIAQDSKRVWDKVHGNTPA